MTYFFDNEWSDSLGRKHQEKGRVYSVTDKKGSHLWWEAGCSHLIDGVEVDFSGCSDFMDGAFLGLTDDDKRRALKRKSQADKWKPPERCTQAKYD